MSDTWPRSLLRRPGAFVALTTSVVVLVCLGVNARLGHGPLEKVDVGIALRLNRLVATHPLVVQFWQFVTRAGSPVVWDVVATGVVIALFGLRRPRLAVAGLGSLAGAAVLSTVTKTIVDRPRPHTPVTVDHAAGMSFPSGHAMTSLVAVGFLLLVARSFAPRVVGRPVIAAAGVVVVAIGFSRLILGVHYLTDVVGGWLAGGLWLLGVLVVLERDAARPDRDDERVGRGERTWR